MATKPGKRSEVIAAQIAEFDGSLVYYSFHGESDERMGIVVGQDIYELPVQADGTLPATIDFSRGTISIPFERIPAEKIIPNSIDVSWNSLSERVVQSLYASLKDLIARDASSVEVRVQLKLRLTKSLIPLALARAEHWR